MLDLFLPLSTTNLNFFSTLLQKPFKGKGDRELDRAVVDRKPLFPKEVFSDVAISLLQGVNLSSPSPQGDGCITKCCVRALASSEKAGESDGVRRKRNG